MIRATLITLVVAGLAGCSASLEPVGTNSGDQSHSQQAQLAAFAATESNQFPRDVQASDDLRAAAIVNRDNNTIRIFNFSNEPLRDARLWVNQGYVRQIDTIPANGSKRISYSELYNNRGQTFSTAQTPISHLHLQSGDQLYTLQGPAYE